MPHLLCQLVKITVCEAAPKVIKASLAVDVVALPALLLLHVMLYKSLKPL